MNNHTSTLKDQATSSGSIRIGNARFAAGRRRATPQQQMKGSRQQSKSSRAAPLGIHDFSRSQATRPGKLGFAADVCDGLEVLINKWESLREALKEYGRHDPGCSAEISEVKYRCRCGWKRAREQLFSE